MQREKERNKPDHILKTFLFISINIIIIYEEYKIHPVALHIYLCLENYTKHNQQQKAI